MDAAATGRGCAHQGRGQGPGLTPRQLGERSGAESVALTESQLPAHTHTVQATARTVNSPANAIWAQPRYGRAAEAAYAGSAGATMSPDAMSTTGGGQPHNNLPPYTVVKFIIALQGVYPARD
ncbi:hypothetical protein [Cryobacterium sp. PH29-G1]|uniref:phage tail protein n=1 Tax=Cryobacterium sp. PH29-G1 TaxID=3046211 RepID=UPI0024BA836F|nr:hypothetical protein [Cryobacterium sp. PH29-G1]MDJ0348631.1 hypothetical protein [Cryobacterium sp. PH29-G1]